VCFRLAAVIFVASTLTYKELVFYNKVLPKKLETCLVRHNMFKEIYESWSLICLAKQEEGMCDDLFDI